MPKVSIVLPTYNGEKYLRKSIESVISQTFSDWELIIVDDCSTDATPQISDEYARIDKRIKVIHNNENKKLPDSLNIGFRISHGDYLTWTSDDNLYEKDAIELMYNYLNDNKSVQMVCAQMHIIDENDNIIGQSLNFELKNIYIQNNIGACFMYSRKAYTTIGEYDKNMFCVEDYDYWLRVYNEFKFIGYIREKKYKYRKHPDSLTNTKFDLVTFNLMQLRKKYLNNILRTCDAGMICKIYYDFIENNIDIKDIEYNFFEKIPELKYDNVFNNNNKYVIIGAGEFGKKLFHLLKDKVAFFMDNSVEKLSENICGLEVRSLKDLKKISDYYNILIAVNSNHIYEIINQLKENDVHKFCSIYKFLRKELYNE